MPAPASTAQLLSGLAPPHLSYEPSQRRRVESWLWSVGDSPLAATASGLGFGHHYASVLHRHYVVAGLNASMHALGRAAAALGKIRTSRAVYARLQEAHASPGSTGAAGGAAGGVAGGAENVAAGAENVAAENAAEDGGAPVLRLRTALAKTRQLQQRILGLAARLELDAAAKQLHALQKASDGLVALANRLAARLTPANCASGPGVAGGMPPHAGGVSYLSYLRAPTSAVLVAAGLAALLLHVFCPRLLSGRGRRRGPKVNLD